MDGPTPGSEACERARFDYVNTTTGQFVPGRCRASFCPYCGPIEAWWKARIISDGGGSAPERYAVLTQAPDDWSTLRQKMRDLRRVMVKRHGEYEQAWTVEVGGRTGMRHVNVLQKGTYVPQRELQATWGGIVHIKAIRRTPGQLAGYALKEALKVSGYSLKEAGAGADGLEQFLENNGGRLVHLSRGYLGGQRQADVLKRLIAERQEGDQAWIAVPRASGTRKPGT